MKTLENFLSYHDACADLYKFAKDLTLVQFLNTCQSGEWILWLFAKMNPDSIRPLITAQAQCVATVRHLLGDVAEEGLDVALHYVVGELPFEAVVNISKRLENIYKFLVNDIYDDGKYPPEKTEAVRALYYTVGACYHRDAEELPAFHTAIAAAHDALPFPFTQTEFDTTMAEHQKIMADICRNCLPIQFWNQDQL